MRRRRRASAVLLAAAVTAAGPRPGVPPGGGRPPAARGLGAEEGRLADARIAAAAALRVTETDAAALSAEVEALTARAHDAEARVAERSAALAPLLPVMRRLALYPMETLLSVPVPQDRALQGLAVMRGLARRLEQEAASLRADAAVAQDAARDAAAALDRLRAAQAVQAGQSADLDRQLEAARAGRLHAEDAAAEQARRAATEAARTETLHAALAALEAERARAEARSRDDAARADRARQDAAAAEARRRQQALGRPAGPGLTETGGPLVAPAAGAVVRGWGDPTDAGPANGMTVRPPPGARVTAPCSGRAAFAGPFRTYGVLLILDCGGGYHFVLAGFERLDVGVGTTVQAGEPVGVMSTWDPRAAGQRPALYIELRRDGLPVNPAPFLRARG